MNNTNKNKIIEVFEIIELLKQSSEYKEWYSNNKDSFLAHIFKMIDNSIKSNISDNLNLKDNETWQVGYYNSSSDKMATFSVDISSKKITYFPEDEVFKKPERKIYPINMNLVKLDSENAFKLSLKLQNEKFTSYKPLKTMMILQNNSENILLWNVTFFTGSVNTINIKLNATTSEIISQKMINLIG